MYHIKIQSYISPDPFPLLQRDYISSIFPFRIARRKDTVARYKSINIAVYDSIPFSVSTRLIVFWIVAIFLFISPAQIHIYIYRFRFRSQRASNNTEERWCQAFATAYHGQSRKLECATRMRVPPSTCYGEECAIILELGYRWDIRTLCF